MKELQNGLLKLNNQEPLLFNQEDASTYILMKEKIPTMTLFYLQMLVIGKDGGHQDILSSNTKFMTTSLNNGSLMKQILQSITILTKIISSKTITENSQLDKLVKKVKVLNSQEKENGTGMVLQNNSKLKLEIILTLLVSSTHQNQTSMLKSESIA